VTPSPPHRVGIAGASGRMGRMLVEAVLAADDCRIGAAFDQPGSAALGVLGAQHLQALQFDTQTETLPDPSRVRPASMSGCGSISCS